MELLRIPRNAQDRVAATCLNSSSSSSSSVGQWCLAVQDLVTTLKRFQPLLLVVVVVVVVVDRVCLLVLLVHQWRYQEVHSLTGWWDGEVHSPTGRWDQRIHSCGDRALAGTSQRELGGKQATSRSSSSVLGCLAGMLPRTT
jgi:hypothetical protein